MEPGIPILATVTATETGEFEAGISHLTLTTAFIETMHSANFGEPVELRVSEVVVKAEVVFVADAPMGWVVRFDPCPELLNLAGIGTGDQVELSHSEAEDVTDIEIEDPVTFIPGPALWGDPTPTFDGPPPNFKS